VLQRVQLIYIYIYIYIYKAKRASGDAISAAAANECFREFNCKVTVDDFDILHMIGEGGFGKVYQVN
jgi:hypothetical protein